MRLHHIPTTMPPPHRDYGSLLDHHTSHSRWRQCMHMLVTVFMTISSFLIAIIQTYGKAIRWSCLRPTWMGKIIAVTSVILATLAAILGVAGLLTPMGQDPCNVQQEWLHKLETTNNNPQRCMPKLIHQQWKSSVIPPETDMYRFQQEFMRLFSQQDGFEYQLWTDTSMRELIASQYAWFLPCFDNYAHPIQRVDAARYFILYTLGGMYADLDYEPLQNFWDFLPKDRPGFIESPYKYNERVQNSLMSSPVGHPIWNITFQVLMERCKRTDVLTSTGPSMVDEVLRRAELAGVEFYELPCENFHRIPIGERAGKSSPWLTTMVREIVSRTPLVKQCGDVSAKDECQFGIHHNAATWLGSSFF